MAGQQRLTLQYVDVTDEPGPAPPHADVVRAFEALGYRVVGLVRADVHPGGFAMLADDYAPAERAAMLDHLPEPRTVLVSGDALTVVQVGWFWSWPGVELVSVTAQGSRVETHWGWDCVPPWPAKAAAARRFATVDGEMRRSAARGRSVAAVQGADAARLHGAHHAHVQAHADEHGEVAVPLPVTLAELVPLLEQAHRHAQSVADRGALVVSAGRRLALAAASATLGALLLHGHLDLAVVWLVTAVVGFHRFYSRVAVRTFYTGWWRPAYR